MLVYVILDHVKKNFYNLKYCDIKTSTISLRIYNIRSNFIVAILTFCGYALFFLVSYTEFVMAKKRCINMIYKQNMAW